MVGAQPDLGWGAVPGDLIVVKHPTVSPQTGALDTTHGSVTNLHQAHWLLQALPASHTEILQR